MDKDWNEAAWKDYQEWERTAPHIIKRIKKLLADIECHPYTGIGKPEPLKWNLKGYWSRRITDEHRLIYKIEMTPEGEILYIYSCKEHYE